MSAIVTATGGVFCSEINIHSQLKTTQRKKRISSALAPTLLPGTGYVPFKVNNINFYQLQGSNNIPYNIQIQHNLKTSTSACMNHLIHAISSSTQELNNFNSSLFKVDTKWVLGDNR